VRFGQQSTLNKKIARRYSHAAFSLAKAKNIVEKVRADMMLLDQTVKVSADFRDFLNMPHMKAEISTAIFKGLFKDNIEPQTMDLLNLLADKGRLNILPNIIEAFEIYYKQSTGLTKVQIISAVELEEKQVDRICEKLKARWNREVTAETLVDPELIGGFQIKAGDRVLDLSLKGQLDQYHQKVINA